MANGFELQLQLIMNRSMVLDMAVANARRDPELLRRMITNLKCRMAVKPADDDVALLRWAEAMLAIHHLRDREDRATGSS